MVLIILSFLFGLSLSFRLDLRYVCLFYTLDGCDKLLKLFLRGIIVLNTLLPCNDKPSAPVKIHRYGLGQGNACPGKAPGIVGDKTGAESVKALKANRFFEHPITDNILDLFSGMKIMA